MGRDDQVTFRAGDGDVEEAFFLFGFAVAFGVVAGEFVFGHTGDEDGVEFKTFGLVDGEDGDAGVVEGEEVEVAREGDAMGECGEHFLRRARWVVVIVKELDEAPEVGNAGGFALVVGEEAGFVEDVIAEDRRAVGGRVFAPGIELVGDWEKERAKAGNEVVALCGAGG